MAERILEDSGELAKSSSPISVIQVEEPEGEGHPGQRASIVNVPVTPGIHLGEYASDESKSSNRPGTSYFSQNVSKLRTSMAQSPTEAASGAQSGKEILRRMSLHKRADAAATMANVDPREANPTLGLSGGLISATFCIPHKVHHRKGSEWVRNTFPSVARKLLIASR